MAERHNEITNTRGEHRAELTRPRGGDRSGNPFTALQRMADDMDRMFENFGFGSRLARPFFRETETEIWAPQIDVFQRNNELTIRADLPGLKREDVTVDISDSEVCIQGERKHEREEDREGYYRSERSYGSFYRVIPLPEGTITDQAKANFNDGVLEITMPAPPASKGRRLEIAEGGRK
jgi:HSP20 family protein